MFRSDRPPSSLYYCQRLSVYSILMLLHNSSNMLLVKKCCPKGSICLIVTFPPLHSYPLLNRSPPPLKATFMEYKPPLNSSLLWVSIALLVSQVQPSTLSCTLAVWHEFVRSLWSHLLILKTRKFYCLALLFRNKSCFNAVKVFVQLSLKETPLNENPHPHPRAYWNP